MTRPLAALLACVALVLSAGVAVGGDGPGGPGLPPPARRRAPAPAPAVRPPAPSGLPPAAAAAPASGAVAAPATAAGTAPAAQAAAGDKEIPPPPPEEPAEPKPPPDDGRLPPPKKPKIDIHAEWGDWLVEDEHASAFVLLGNPKVVGDERSALPFSVRGRTIVVWMDRSKSPDLASLMGSPTDAAEDGAGSAKPPRRRRGSPRGGASAATAVAGSKEKTEGGLSPVGDLSTSLDAVLGIYAEGGVELRSGDLTFRGVELYFDPQSDRALIVEPRFEASVGSVAKDDRALPIFVRARRARLLSEGFLVFDDAEASSSRSSDRVAVRVRTLSIEEFGVGTAQEPLFLGFRPKPASPKEKSKTAVSEQFVAHGIEVRGERVPFFFAPYGKFGGDEGLRRVPTITAGKRSSIGYYAFAGLTRTLGERNSATTPWAEATVEGGGYTKRGPALGTDLKWTFPGETPRDPKAVGRFQTFSMYDATGRDRTGFRADEGYRGFAELESQWQWTKDLRFDVEGNVFSDRGVNHEYFESDARDHKDRETYARVRWLAPAATDDFGRRLSAVTDVASGREMLTHGAAGGALTLGVHAREFATESFGVPEATFFAESVPLPGRLGVAGLDLSTEARVGRLARRIDEMLPDPEYEATRFDVTERVYAPFSLGDVRVSPFVGGRWTGYYDRTDGGDDVLRGAMEAGVRANLELHRDFAAYGGPWSLDGLRNVVDIDVGATARLLDSHDLADVPFFDRVDKEEDRTEIFAEFRNRLETRRLVGGKIKNGGMDGGVRQNDTVFDARLRVAYWPEGIGPYGRRGPGEAEGWLQWELVPRTAWLLGSALAEFDPATFERASIGVVYRPVEDFSLGLGVRHVQHELLAPWFDAYWRWAEKWALRLSGSDDLDRSGDGSLRVAMLRFSGDHYVEFGARVSDRGHDAGIFFNVSASIGGDPLSPPYQSHDDIVGTRP